MSNTKLKPCATGKRHSWVFVRNRNNATQRISGAGTMVSSRKVGVYKCACGARKEGEVGHQDVTPAPLAATLQVACEAVLTPGTPPTGSDN